MADIVRSADELAELLDEQISFLKASCAAFDSGFVGEIKRLAVSVRVLVHDTKTSTSLLTLTDRKGIQFFDSADPYDDENLVGHSSLVQIHLGSTGAKPKPHLDDVLEPRETNFETWWNGVVLVDAQRNEFSRRDIVLSLANKDGGAHVDHKIDEAYNNLRKNNAQGWITVDEAGREVPAEDNVPATMRQIAHELLRTLNRDYRCDRPIVPGTGILVRGMSLTTGDRPSELGLPNLRKDRPVVDGRKIGRNDLCPCGSGKKYKKCCLR
ncbi:MAG: SEC-C metal-binding domain-containing protein [Sphingomonadaceae bacterium]|nr:SEC-C metal-binding domain-containing protein [Sphingomonadaceae bacterium]